MTRRTLFSRLLAGFAALPLVGKATAKPVVNVDFMRGSGMPPPLSTYKSFAGESSKLLPRYR